MRFSAAVKSQPPLHSSLVAQLNGRRPMSIEPAERPQPAPTRPEDPPADLDQRVRLIGEW